MSSPSRRIVYYGMDPPTLPSFHELDPLTFTGFKLRPSDLIVTDERTGMKRRRRRLADMPRGFRDVNRSKQTLNTAVMYVEDFLEHMPPALSRSDYLQRKQSLWEAKEQFNRDEMAAMLAKDYKFLKWLRARSAVIDEEMQEFQDQRMQQHKMVQALSDNVHYLQPDVAESLTKALRENDQEQLFTFVTKLQQIGHPSYVFREDVYGFYPPLPNNGSPS